MMGGGGPKQYQRLEYCTITKAATATGIIDTGLPLDSTIDYSGTFATWKVANIIDDSIKTSGKRLGVATSKLSNIDNSAALYGCFRAVYSTILPFKYDVINSFSLKKNGKKYILTYNDVEYATEGIGDDFITSGTYYIGRNQAEGAFRIYDLIFTQQNHVLRDYVAVSRLADGKVGLLDRKNMVFYPPIGNDLVAGPEVPGELY